MKRFMITYLLFQIIIPNDTLAIVGENVITKNDFMKRAEYTIRPQYCNSSNNIDKKIVLNSLIAEKILAAECKPELDIDKKRFLRGITDQAMRRVMLEDQVNSNLAIDSQIITDLYNKSLISYEVDFLSFSNKNLDSIKWALETEKNFTDISRIISTKPANKKLRFLNSSKKVQKELFNKERNLSEIIGPIEISNNEYILIKIINKNRIPIIGLENQKKHYEDIKDNYIELESIEIRKHQISNIMSDKKIEFNKKVFLKLANYYYYNNDRKSINLEDILFTLDNKQWTIDELIQLNHFNPLIFRESYDNISEFYEQFKLGIVDIIQNHYITLKAYEMNYSNHPAVVKERRVWKDYMLASYKKEQLINNYKFESNSFDNEYKIIEKILNKELDALFSKYSDLILIDVDMFNKIQLSNIDMFAVNINQPYQLTVPPFPRLTTKINLDYGVKKDL